MAALTVPLVLRRQAGRRRSAFEYLGMAVVTIAIFVVALLVIERVTDTPLVSRIIHGTIAARTRADYSVTIGPRIRPVRSSVTNGTAPSGTTSPTPVATRAATAIASR